MNAIAMAITSLLRAPARNRRKSLALVIAAVVIPTAAPAHADTVTGAAQDVVEGRSGPLAPVTTIQSNAEATAGGTVATIDAQVKDALTVDPNNPEQFIATKVSEILAQVSELTDLADVTLSASPGTFTSEVDLHVDAASVRVDRKYQLDIMPECLDASLECLPARVIDTSGELSRDWEVQTTYMHFVDDSFSYWTEKESKGRVDGNHVVVLYKANESPRPGFDYFGTSQWASVSPRNGHKLTQLRSYLKPKEPGIEIVHVNPGGVREQDQGGSTTIGASLGSEGAGSVSISRSWNWYKGAAGGVPSSDHMYYATWQSAGGGGSRYTTEVAGVGTWKQPVDEHAAWSILGMAWTN